MRHERIFSMVRQSVGSQGRHEREVSDDMKCVKREWLIFNLVNMTSSFLKVLRDDFQDLIPLSLFSED